MSPGPVSIQARPPPSERCRTAARSSRSPSTIRGWAPGERLAAAGWVGSALILGGMLVSEVLGNLTRAKESLPLEVEA